jgi:hypothetical protein
MDELCLVWQRRLFLRAEVLHSTKMAATSMAAALAASLPAPQAAPTPAAPTYEAIPASMSKVIDIEAEIPLACVQLDGLVSTSWMELWNSILEPAKLSA